MAGATGPHPSLIPFLGFDGISTMSEEVKGGIKIVGKATVATLLVVGALFIVQTWVASDLGAGMKLTNLDTAFYDIAGKAGGTWLKNLTIIATAFSWGNCKRSCRSSCYFKNFVFYGS